jgi:hypothetical protein
MSLRLLCFFVALKTFEESHESGLEPGIARHYPKGAMGSTVNSFLQNSLLRIPVVDRTYLSLIGTLLVRTPLSETLIQTSSTPCSSSVSLTVTWVSQGKFGTVLAASTGNA